MYRLLLIPLLSFLTSTAALSDVNQQCIAENSETLNNDLILGTWYNVYRFTLFGGLLPSISCPMQIFTKPTADVVAEYKAKYNSPDLPYSLDDNPLIRNDTYRIGMVTGQNQAKFYVLDPKSVSIVSVDGYGVHAFKLLGNDYLMWRDCALRGNTILLYSKNRDAPESEMEELIRNTPELARLGRQRYCSPR